ncbi:hypothetical protein [Pseudomarimonas arenosa]|uniref:Uncharacterized protein n=1 Tax=Pseudomarimonas arenosa TaxID=2774145 RepID=A0AAW3ZGX2_9GAMM|nr:hypothetical protein [Pseudomarimonas arenosa]MBD8525271.1 hypothetical protein [Pseudomarimonas arenosa]
MSIRRRLRAAFENSHPEDRGGAHARPFFRLLALLFCALVALIPYSIIRAWWLGEAPPDTSALQDAALILGGGTMTLCFAFVAITARVPAALWRLWWRITKLV